VSAGTSPVEESVSGEAADCGELRELMMSEVRPRAEQALGQLGCHAAE
jgi:hypothetical protein